MLIVGEKHAQNRWIDATKGFGIQHNIQNEQRLALKQFNADI